MQITPIDPLLFLPPAEFIVQPIGHSENVTASAVPQVKEPQFLENNKHAPRIGTAIKDNTSKEETSTSGKVSTEPEDPVHMKLRPEFSQMIRFVDPDDITNPDKNEISAETKSKTTPPEALSKQNNEQVAKSEFDPTNPQSSNISFDFISTNANENPEFTKTNDSENSTNNISPATEFDLTNSVTIGPDEVVVEAARSTVTNSSSLNLDSDTVQQDKNNDIVTEEIVHEAIEKDNEILVKRITPDTKETEFTEPINAIDEAIEASHEEPVSQTFTATEHAGTTGTISNPNELGESTLTEGSFLENPSRGLVADNKSRENNEINSNTRLINPVPANTEDLFGLDEQDTQQAVGFRPTGSSALGEPQREVGQDFFDSNTLQSTSIRTFINPTAAELEQPETDGIVPKENPNDSGSLLALKVASTFDEILSAVDNTVLTTGHKSGIFFFA